MNSNIYFCKICCKNHSQVFCGSIARGPHVREAAPKECYAPQIYKTDVLCWEINLRVPTIICVIQLKRVEIRTVQHIYTVEDRTRDIAVFLHSVATMLTARI